MRKADALKSVNFTMRKVLRLQTENSIWEWYKLCILLLKMQLFVFDFQLWMAYFEKEVMQTTLRFLCSPNRSTLHLRTYKVRMYVQYIEGFKIWQCNTATQKCWGNQWFCSVLFWGEVCMMMTNSNCEWWLFRAAICGGCLTDYGDHKITRVRYMYGSTGRLLIRTVEHRVVLLQKRCYIIINKS